VNEHKRFKLVQVPLGEVIALHPAVFIDALRCYKERSSELKKFVCEGGLDLVSLSKG
jgi:hypothetical protein